MDKPSFMIEAQKQQLLSYQSKLKDAADAYKNLLEEKEILNATISAFSAIDENQELSNDKSRIDGATKQLMNSLATLSAEKSRMEASFQADKKSLRQELLQKDAKINELKETLKRMKTHHQMETESFKLKLVSCDRMLTDERPIKENLGADKIVKELNQELDERKKELEDYKNDNQYLMKEIENLKNQLMSEKLKTREINEKSRQLTALHEEKVQMIKEFSQKLDNREKQSKFYKNSNQNLMEEIKNLKKQHMDTLKTEKQKAKNANEKFLQLTDLHEEKVQNLESQLNELKLTVARYQELREKDQKSIYHLKNTIIQLSGDIENVYKQTSKDFTDNFMKIKNIVSEQYCAIDNSLNEVAVIDNNANNTATKKYKKIVDNNKTNDKTMINATKKTYNNVNSRSIVNGSAAVKTIKNTASEMQSNNSIQPNQENSTLLNGSRKERSLHYCSIYVVSAYKSLLKEKEALDASISVLSSSANENQELSNDKSKIDDATKQLMNSLATLSSEKSRMEASFQADKKSLRQELSQKDSKINELKETLKNLTMSLQMEKESFKSKLVSYDRMLTDERHLKENLETQLKQLKTQFSLTSNADKIMKELNQELSDTKRKLKAYENNNQNLMKNDSTSLQLLHEEKENLKKQHMDNLMTEKLKTREANDKSRQLTALHEERVQSLESRLSELSLSVARYHNLREQDQKNIFHLKDTISQLTRDSENVVATDTKQKNFSNIQVIMDELDMLKHLLIYENTKLDNPIDLSLVLSVPTSSSEEATVSYEKFQMYKKENDKVKSENEVLKAKIIENNVHIATLQEKIEVLNQNLDDLDKEVKNKSIEINNVVKTEKSKWREIINQMESEHRSKVSQLEQQLQKQRERSLILLEEKENEIKTLKTSNELFIPKHNSFSYLQFNLSDKDSSETEKNVERKISSSTQNLPETHMIYYSNELARKDIELSTTRKAKREAEDLIRQTLKEKIMIQEELSERIKQLELEVHKLERSKSRESANLEYLKNVTLSFLLTSDPESRKKMLNAITAVLKFDESEIAQISILSSKKK
ncbi:CLUMA_CG011849, isoform A [Clunio marinus]|uniref:CLUMA_CG011849, isoform A n=1 Tax=Clunio marinus TaxID=568069 RepID=A0A1J1IG32_9DIPT|nr:CLUMA_CG011849, isoform A [Clunio marinus]